MKKGWTTKKCSCIGGRRGPYGDECGRCGGMREYFIHYKSGVMAMWPGGPFLGKLDKEEIKALQSGVVHGRL